MKQGSRRNAQPVTRRAMLLSATAGGAVVFTAAGCAVGGGSSDAKPVDLANQSGELSWMIAARTPETDSWFKDTLIPAWQKDRPKAKVSMTVLTGFPELFEKRGPLFAAGSAPDILQAGADDLVEYAANKWALNLNDRVAKWADWQDFYPVPTEATKYDGKTIGIPAQMRPRALVLRKDLFEQRSVALPSTWDEMRTAAVRMTERSGDQITRAGFNPAAWAYQQFFPMVWQSGGEMVSPDGRKVLFNTAKTIDGLQFWNDLLNTVQPPGATLPQGASLVTGGLASAIDAQNVLDTAIKTAPEVVSQILVRPPLKKEKAMSFFSTNWFAIGSQTKQPDLAWDVLAYFNKAENLLEYNRTNATTVPRKSMRSTGFMGDARYQMPSWIEVVEKYARTHPPVVNIAQVNTVTSDALAAVRANKKSPKDAVEEMARGIQQIYDEFFASRAGK